ncbi:MAG TPA: Hpt domain-containing protein [Rhizomicrobium sp.]|jgi:HPt (histidine-containing phosphotransfer) domain-containing protein
MSASARPVDLAHLARYTGGDAALDAEVLQLFIDQSAILLRDLQAVLETRDTKSWKYITHSLKGAARGIGAFALADVAAEAEPIDPAVQAEAAAAAVSALQAKAEGVQLFVRDYLGH